MAYEKPELFTLSLATPAIRMAVDHDRKGSKVHESGNPIDGGVGGDGNPVDRQDTSETSSSGGAYEADE